MICVPAGFPSSLTFTRAQGGVLLKEGTHVSPASGHRTGQEPARAAEAMTAPALSADLAVAKVAWFAIRREVQRPGRSFPSAGYHLDKIRGLSGSVPWLCLLCLSPPAPARAALAPWSHRNAGCLLPGQTADHWCSLQTVVQWSFPRETFPAPTSSTLLVLDPLLLTFVTYHSL